MLNMRNVSFALSFLLLLSLMGCTRLVIPKYISDDNPYKKVFYTDFDKSVLATEKALEDLGWTISEKADPVIYERTKSLIDSDTKQILIFTEAKKAFNPFGSTRKQINVYLRSEEGEGTTEIELRYLKVASLTFKIFYRYKNNKLMDRLFEEIGKEVNK